ncbi:MAG: zinc ribbon domain-containing protein [Anaerovibrio sp.]|uniref:zinc ribbon domain-containing protein n=1 Tax=Anaerovibrio sp. TaxID=1872532 RepID=UPI0025DF3E44|nr:zinc ribbon domain-containing protein [Anaerovibrio sp.]MCR5175761.1 zinc ribbon domain-containing protein [Anaerovibrio sp.]
MSKFCKKCGAELKDDAGFCPKCGTSQNVMAGNGGVVRNSVSGSTGNGNKDTVIIAAVAAVVILLGVFFIFFHGSIDEVKETLHIGTAQATSTQAEPEAVNPNAAQPAQPTPSNPAISRAEQELRQKGVQGTVLASSVGHSGNGYLSLVNNNGQYHIVTYDTKNGRVGVTPYDRKTLYFTDNKPSGGSNAIVIFNINVLNDVSDKDNGAGVWESGNHNIPVYAFYKFDGSGNVVPGMLNTGKGVNPSHYHGYFYEPRNVDTINLFLTEMQALQKNIADNNVRLP